jgi:hypothetical protein
MGKEGQPPGASEVRQGGTPIKGVLIDLQKQSLTLLSRTDVLATVSLSPTGLVFEPGTSARPEPAAVPEPTQTPIDAPAAAARTDSAAERAHTVTLHGRLKSKPKEGRQDAQGRPTAWARFAAHEDDRDTAHIYSTTFHRHTASIALGLDSETPLTVQGYPHIQDDPGSKRMDSLSVINLVDYPGKGTGKDKQVQEAEES